MKKAIWIIGIIVLSISCIFMISAIRSTLSDQSTSTSELSAQEATAYTWQASQLFCAGVYYTDKVLTTDPSTISYEEWQEYVEQANTYWDALDEVLTLLDDQIDDETFEDMFEDQEASNRPLFGSTAYAFDSAEIINTFDSAAAGKRLKAVADYLGKDMEYAQQALKMANGQITAESWNDFADTAQNLEAAARVTKTAAQSSLLVLGGPASGAIEGTALVVGGASLIWQATDDGCFIVMGDEYDRSEFVANLQKVSDAVAPIAFVSDILTMDFSSIDGAVLASYSFAENLRGVIQDGKVAGIQLKGPSGNVVSLTPEELLDYQIARGNGQDTPSEINALLDVVEDKPSEPQQPNDSAQGDTENVEEEDFEYADLVGGWYALSIAETIGNLQSFNGITEETSGAYLTFFEDATAEYMIRVATGNEIIDGDKYYHDITYDNDYILNDYAYSDALDYPIILHSDGYLYLEMTDAELDTTMYMVFARKGEENDDDMPSVVGTYSAGVFDNEYLGGTTESVYIYNADGTFQYGNIHSTKSYELDVLYEGTYKVIQAGEYESYVYQIMEYENGNTQASGSMMIYESDMKGNQIVSLSGTYFRK